MLSIVVLKQANKLLSLVNARNALYLFSIACIPKWIHLQSKLAWVTPIEIVNMSSWKTYVSIWKDMYRFPHVST